MADNQINLKTLSGLAGYLVRRASTAFSADFANAMEGTGLRQPLVGILAIVFDNPGINQGTVGRILGIKGANMVPLINELMELGFVDRAADPDDRRAFILHISEQGQEKLDQAMADIAEHEARMLKNFTDIERTLFLQLLAKIPY